MFRCKIHNSLLNVIGGLWRQRVFYSTYEEDPIPIQMVYSVFRKDPEIRKTLSPLVILHGLFGSKQNWNGIGEKLEKALKRKIFTLDARNHGDSPRSKQHSSAHLREDVKLFFDLQRFRKACLMGHSMGGRAMILFALKYPLMVENAIIIDISTVTLPRNRMTIDKMFKVIQNTSVPKELNLAKGRELVEHKLNQVLENVKTTKFMALNLRKGSDGEFYWVTNNKAIYRNIKLFSDFLSYVGTQKPYPGPIMFICNRKSRIGVKANWAVLEKVFPNGQIHWVDDGDLLHVERPMELINMVISYLKQSTKK